MQTEFNPISFACHLTRAYEISKCGNHTIRLINSPNSNDQSLTASDVAIIKSYFGIIENDNADIIIELTKPAPAEMLSAFSKNRRCETIEDINKRIDDFFLTQFREFDRTIKGSCESLLKTGIEKLDLDFSEITKILNVAETISKLGGSNEYRAEYIAEALHYQSSPTEYRRKQQIL